MTYDGWNYLNHKYKKKKPWTVFILLQSIFQDSYFLAGKS